MTRGEERRQPRARGMWPALIVGLVIGAILTGPAGAHIGTTVAHLWTKHIKPLADARYVRAHTTTTVAIGAHEFVPVDDTFTISYSDSRGATGRVGSTDIFAPISLPNGATITRIRCVLYDVSATDDIGCIFRTAPHDSTAVDPGSDFLVSTGSSGFQVLSDTTLSNTLVRNVDHHYYVQVAPGGGDTWDGLNTAVKAVLVTYKNP